MSHGRLPRRIQLSGLIAAVLVALVIVSVAKADALQPISVSWTNNTPPKAFYDYGEKLSYRFTITSTSTHVEYIHVYAETFANPSKVFLTSSITRTYVLQPGKSIKFLFQAYAPDGAAISNPEFTMDASIEAEGYPSLRLSADAWHDTGK